MIQEESDKPCGKCNRTLNNKSYYFWPSGRRYTYCRECSRAIEKNRYYDRKNTTLYMEAHRKAQTTYRISNPDKIMAHRLAGKFKNKLIKNKCENCSSSGKLYLHHPDYNYPTLVTTLCSPCHVETHRKALT